MSNLNCLKNICKICYDEHNNHPNLIDFAIKNSKQIKKIENINHVFKLDEEFYKLDVKDVKDNNILLKNY